MSLNDADAIILPGVGNFRKASRSLEAQQTVIMEAISSGVPVFGICLGMQLFFEESEESEGRGLGIFEGKVVRLPNYVKRPHMGWNTLLISQPDGILSGIDENDYFYFVHSYYVNPRSREIVIAETEHGVRFASVIRRKNIIGVQFHPEKSGRPGKRVIQNFARIIKR